MTSVYQMPDELIRDAQRRLRERLREAGLEDPTRPEKEDSTLPDPGIYTLRSPRGHRTFRLAPVRFRKGDDPRRLRQAQEGKLVLELLLGPDNTTVYTSLCFLDADPPRVWKRHQNTINAKLARVFWRFVVQKDVPPDYSVEWRKL